MLPVFLAFNSLIVQAQTVQKEIPQADWMVAEGSGNTNWRGYNGLSSSELGDKSQTPKPVLLQNGAMAAIAGTKNGAGVIAIDEKMNIRWQCSIFGYPLTLGKLHGNLLAISASDVAKLTGIYSNTLTASLIDPETGKVILQKTIYSGSEDITEQPLFFFSADGSFFKMAIRVSHMKRKANLNLMDKLMQQFGETESFSLFELDEKLEKKNSINLDLEPGGFGGALCNSKGEVFIKTIPSQNTIQVARYVPGSPKAAKTLVQTIDARKKNFNSKFLVSNSNPSVVYLATLFEDANKETAFSVCRLNFTDGTQKEQKEVFTKSSLRDLEKNYTEINKKMDKPDLQLPDQLKLLELEELGDRVVVTMTPASLVATQNQEYREMGSLLLSSYDTDLNHKTQTIIPRFHTAPLAQGISFHREGNMLKFITNGQGGLSNKAIYGQLDLQSGKVLKLQHIEKDKIEKANPADPNSVFWFPSGFVISYLNMKRMGTKIVADLQLVSY